MGAGISSPIDDATQQRMESIVGETLKVFSEKYPKEYAVALLKKVIAESQKPGESPFQLEERPPAHAFKDPIKIGWMTKEGSVVKNWKKRIFVVRNDYKIDYYDKEETFKSGGAPKGTINPCGYRVVTDAQSALAKKVEELAAKLKVDVSSLTKPKSLPPNTLALLKDRRRDWFIQFESESQLQEWAPILRDCCSKARGLNSQDPVAIAAYNQAFTATRESRGYYNGRRFNGSEEQNLSDLIFLQLHYEVLDEIFGKLDELVPNAKLRTMVSDKIDSVVQTTVNTAVSAAWTASNKAIETTRPTIESKMRADISGVVDANDKVKEKIRGSVSSTVDPAVGRAASPLADAVIPTLLSPITKALNDLVAVFDTHSETAVSTISSGQDENQVWRDLARLPWIVATLAEATEKLTSLNKILDHAEKIPALKSDAQMIEHMIETAREGLQKLLDNAFYTLQQEFADKSKDGKDKSAAIKDARAETRAKLLHDCRETCALLVRRLLGEVVLPPIKKEVLTPCEASVAPIEADIPDILKGVLDLNRSMEETIEDIVNDALDRSVRPSLPSFS